MMPTTTWSHREANAPPVRLMMMITSASAISTPLPCLVRAQHNTGGETGHGPFMQRRATVDDTGDPGISCIRDDCPADARRGSCARSWSKWPRCSRSWRWDVTPASPFPSDHLGAWLRDGDPATVVIALLRWVALVGAGWLLASTLLYLAATVSRVPAAVRAVGWTTPSAVRRTIDAACAASVVASVVLAPSVAGAVQGSARRAAGDRDPTHRERARRTQPHVAAPRHDSTDDCARGRPPTDADADADVDAHIHARPFTGDTRAHDGPRPAGRDRGRRAGRRQPVGPGRCSPGDGDRTHRVGRARRRRSRATGCRCARPTATDWRRAILNLVFPGERVLLPAVPAVGSPIS